MKKLIEKIEEDLFRSAGYLMKNEISLRTNMAFLAGKLSVLDKQSKDKIFKEVGSPLFKISHDQNLSEEALSVSAVLLARKIQEYRTKKKLEFNKKDISEFLHLTAPELDHQIDVLNKSGYKLE
jgi:hypothetical protein